MEKRKKRKKKILYKEMQVSLLAKYLAVYAIALCILLLISWKAFGADINAEIKWAVNGMPNTGGFIVYAQPAGTSELIEIQRVEDASARTWIGMLPVEEGVNRFAMKSYSGTVESDLSEVSTYEWLKPETGGLPIPTILIQFSSGVPE